MPHEDWKPADLKAWRHNLDWSQQRAAEALGIARESYARLEIGQHPIDVRTKRAAQQIKTVEFALKARRDSLDEIAHLEAGHAPVVTITVEGRLLDTREEVISHNRHIVRQMEELLDLLGSPCDALEQELGVNRLLGTPT